MNFLQMCKRCCGLIAAMFLGFVPAAASAGTMAEYEIEVAVECDSAAAENAELKFLPLPPGKSVAFSCRWDDNNFANIRMKKLMQKYGYKGTFYLLRPNPEFRKKVMPELHKDGFTIGNHTLNHYSLSLLTPNGIFYEMIQARVLLETLSNQTLTAFIFPNGNYNDPFYANVPQIISSSLRRTGMLGGPDNATASLGKMPGNEFFSPEGKIVYPGDRNTSCERFDKHVARYMPPAGKTAHMTLGIHVWHSDEDFLKLEESMKKYSGRQDWWYCNENEFLAYSYMYRHAKVSAKKVNGKTAVFTVKMPCPEYLGSETPLWAECGGKNVKISHNRKMPVRIATANADGSVKGFPGLNVRISFVGSNRIRLEVKNSAEELKDVRMLLRLPPDFAEETLYTYVDCIAGNFVKEWTLTDNPAGKSSGMQMTALQMDFTRQNAPERLWVTHIKEVPSVKPAMQVFGSAKDFSEDELARLSLIDTAIDPQIFLPTTKELNLRESMFKVNAKALNRASQTVLVEFNGGQKMLLKGSLPDTVYCNGQKLKAAKGTLHFDAPQGKCRIVFQHKNMRRPLRLVQLILTPEK